MLSLKEYQEMGKKLREEKEALNKKLDEVRRQELKKQGIIIEEKKDKERKFHGDCDSPYTMENSTATILYIITMVGGSIFTDRILIWIFATIIWFNHISRHWK